MKVRGRLPEPKPTPHHPDEVAPGALILDPQRLALALSQSRELEYVAPELLDLTEQALGLIVSYRPRFAASAAQFAPPAEQVAMRLQEGFFLLDAEQLHPDTAALADLLRDVVELASFTEEPVRATIAAWADKIVGDPAALTALARANVQRGAGNLGDAAEKAGLSTEVFAFLQHHFGAAILPAYASHLAGHVEDEKWLRGNCPICGNAPLIAGLAGDGGKRHLVCEACLFVWTFPRLKCPFCANHDQETLKILSPGEESVHHLAVCDVCKHYIKTVDYRRADAALAVLLPVEDAAAVYLDIMAGDAGYGRI